MNEQYDYFRAYLESFLPDDDLLNGMFDDDPAEMTTE